MKRCVFIFVLAFGAICAAQDTTITVTAVNMETGARSNEYGGRTYTWHSMTIEMGGATYRIGTERRRDQWLHKGSYTGRWKDAKRKILVIDVPDGNKTKRFEYRILSEE